MKILEMTHELRLDQCYYSPETFSRPGQTNSSVCPLMFARLTLEFVFFITSRKEPNQHYGLNPFVVGAKVMFVCRRRRKQEVFNGARPVWRQHNFSSG